MAFRRRLPGCLAGLLILVLGTVVRAGAPPDPLRLIPDQSDVVVKVEQPRALFESVTKLDAVKQLQTLDAFRELYDSTNSRRFYQLIAYFEKEMGVPGPELLDRVAGGGIAVGVKLGPNPAPTLMVIQGRDPEFTGKFAKLGLEVIEQELARQEAKERPEKGAYREVETVKIGTEFNAAVVGAAILVSNSENGLHAAIDLHLDGGKRSLASVESVAEARKLLPGDPLAWGWLNLKTVQQASQGNEVFTLPRNDANLTVLFGGLLDVAGRSPFLCAGLYREADGFVTTIRMPRGREGLNVALSTHVPPAGETGSRPLLRPKGVIVSSSYYLDLSKFWEERTKLFNEKQVKAFEDFDKNSGRFLVGTPLSTLLNQAGAYQRFVLVPQTKPGYQIAPKQSIPAFAIVIEQRDPEKFGKSMEVVLRGAALLSAVSQYKLKLHEEQSGESKIIGYRFPEDVKIPADVNDIRFNFSPSFAAVGNQFVISSTVELARELVDLLNEEARSGTKGDSLAASRTHVYASGAASQLEAIQTDLITQAILGQALPAGEAKEQVEKFLKIVRQLGVLQIESVYNANDFRFDFRLALGR